MNNYRIIYWHKGANGRLIDKTRETIAAADAGQALKAFFGAAAPKLKIDFNKSQDEARLSPPPFTGGQGYRTERVL